MWPTFGERSRATAVALIAFIAASPVAAGAQGSVATARRSSEASVAPALPAPRPRIGYAVLPPEPAPSVPRSAPTYLYPPVYYFNTDAYLLSGVPYVALSDGSVLVNFGGGYERVLRQCAASGTSSADDPYARDPIGRIPDPPGIAALRAGVRGRLRGVSPPPTASACYRVDSRGIPEVVTTR